MEIESIKIDQLVLQLVSRLDFLINSQINSILHNNNFQVLEASWRGLERLLGAVSRKGSVKIKVLNCAFDEFSKDLLGSIDFDQSSFFDKVYASEYDHPGGEPFGIIIADYYFSHQPTKRCKDPVEVLRKASKVAAAAFAPFIAGVSPFLFGIDSFVEFKSTLDQDELFKQEEYDRWNALRREEDSRFIGLSFPRLLLRKPYNQHGIKDKHRYYVEESVSHDDYLWGNSSFAYGLLVIQAFEQYGWFSRLVVSDMQDCESIAVRDYFALYPEKAIPKTTAETRFAEKQIKMSSELGLLCCSDDLIDESERFYFNHSFYQAALSLANSVNIDSKISGMLHYLFCVSRVAHHVKMMMRNKIGSFVSADECQGIIQNWLADYVSDALSEDMKLKAPLRSFTIDVKDVPGQPGKYQCVMYLQPHYALDGINTQLTLKTNISSEEGL